jgi:hypothetical protein
MTAFINSLPTGSIILAAVDDDAGLTTDSFDCLPSPTPGSVCCRPLMNVSAQGIQRLFESLGATQLRRYCFRNSYAIITIKGVGVVGEQLINATDAVVSYTLTLP